MRLKYCLLTLALLAAMPAAAQFTTVSGTVTDPIGIPYANGTVQLSLVLAGGAPLPSGATINGQACCQNTVAATDGNGSFTVLLGDNNVVVPAGTQWRFTVNAAGIPSPLGRGPQSFSVLITITGATQDVGATLRASAPALTVINVSGASHQVNGVAMISSSPINFLDGTNIAITNPAAGNVQIVVTNTFGGGGDILKVQGTPGFGKVPVGTSATDVTWGFSSLPPEPQAGANYTYLGDDAGTPSDNDRGKAICRTHTAAMTDTLGQAGTAAFPANWFAYIKNCADTETLTVNITVSTINVNGTAASSFLLNPGESIQIASDGTNWTGMRGGNEYYIPFLLAVNAWSPNDSVTNYVGQGGNITATGAPYDSSNPALVPRAGTVVEICMSADVGGTLGTGEAVTAVIRKNDTTSSAQSLSITFDARHTSGCAVLTTAFTVAKNDFVNLLITAPAWATNPTGIRLAGYARVVY